MPITVDGPPDQPTISQSLIPPSVYLDHWAIRLFSDNHRLQDRLVRTLARKRGTLVLSHISLWEFARPPDARHCAAAERFLERLLPDIYFTDFRFDLVISQERTHPGNIWRATPTEYRQLVEYFVTFGKERAGQLTMEGFLQTGHAHRERTLQKLTKTLAALRRGLERARGRSEYVRKARSVQPSPERTRTMIVFGELLRNYFLDPAARLSDNDLIDFTHAAMPVNCCDYVLLDAKWANLVHKLKQRIESSGHVMPIAKCFSRRDDGIEAFLLDLANYDIWR